MLSQSEDVATGSQPRQWSACSHSAELEAGFATSVDECM